MKKEKKDFTWLLKLLVMSAVLALFLTGLTRLNSGGSEVQRKQLEDTVRRACVACYATEGVYPPNLRYLQEHYGLQVNQKKYTVFYEIFAENIMPEITVVISDP